LSKASPFWLSQEDDGLLNTNLRPAAQADAVGRAGRLSDRYRGNSVEKLDFEGGLQKFRTLEAI
jgi:hypothetical protein